MSENKDGRRNFIVTAIKAVGVAIAAVTGAKVIEADAATCGWYDTGATRCTANSSCWPSQSYVTQKRQAYYCNGVPTGSYRWVKAYCGC